MFPSNNMAYILKSMHFLKDSNIKNFLLLAFLRWDMTFIEIFFKWTFPDSERINRKNDRYMIGIDENKVFSENNKEIKRKRSKLGPIEWVTYFRRRRGNQKAWFIVPWSNKSQPGKRVVRYKTFPVICLFQHQIDKSSKISPYPQMYITTENSLEISRSTTPSLSN